MDKQPPHGGARRYWAQQVDLQPDGVIDLSTGINPNGWPVPPLPDTVWQRLPEESERLMQAAADYYGSDALLPVSGSQAAIQALPQLRSHSRVGILSPAYQEHLHGWRMAGHQVALLDRSEIEASLPKLDVLVVVNPNNPTGTRFSTTQLLHWHQQLSDRGGWLMVDEAFMDTTPEHSLCHSGEPCGGLIVLRSIGKFFGLAGMRLGFVHAPQTLLQRLDHHLGPWSVSHPAQWVAEQALKDRQWQQQARKQLVLAGDRLQQLLTDYSLKPSGSTALFQWVEATDAAVLFQQLLEQGVLVRQLQQPTALRFGLPASEMEWKRLQQALQQCERLRAVA